MCYIHLDEVSQVVQQAVLEAGGLPFEIRTAAPSDFITSAGKKARYPMPTRDLIVNDIEVMVEERSSMGWCACPPATKLRPAISRLAPCPTSLRSSCRAGTRQAACAPGVTWTSTTCTIRGSVASGNDDLRRARRDDGDGDPPWGVPACNGEHHARARRGWWRCRATRSSARGARRCRFPPAAGGRIVEMVRENLRARDVLTPVAFANAVEVDLAVGGSVNSVRHLAAVVTEAELDLDITSIFEERTEDASLVCEVRPNGPCVGELEEAGGARGVMKQISSRLDASAVTVSGKTVAEIPG